MPRDVYTFAGMIPILLLIAWYGIANTRWASLVRRSEPDIVVDPVTDPVRWATTGPRSVRRLLHLLSAPSSDPEVEAHRRRTRNRAILFVVLAPCSLFGTPVLLAAITGYVQAAIANDPFPESIAAIAAGVGVVAYFAYRLVRATWLFGNGTVVRWQEFVVSIVGVAGSAVGLLAFASR
jgi:hypothetical protein